MAIQCIYAPDLLASLHWYADVLNLPAEALQTEPPALQLPGTDGLMFSAQARPGTHVLPVASVADARLRFEHRQVVPGENQGRIVAAGLGRLSFIDPANNQLTLLEPGSDALAVEHSAG
ncbi:VOC family protein [Hymenobacter glacialis]|uniref:VOC domain-containing protein n=1 Tax=Hymenobacter glacialis TaxID=1908236 RepID=A0A1G1SUY2_9BACT|nr:hypothetical protein [Hymenobacter glacialis]OGX82433.1 hypothetical protein BEN48_17625 [Hymenobacter glacialis]